MAMRQAKIPKREPSPDTGRNTTLVNHAAGTETAGEGFPLHTNRDVMTLLAELLSNQYAFFAGVSNHWRNAWGELPKTTQAITADTSVSQLQWSFEGGLTKSPMICERIAEHCSVDILWCAYCHGCDIPLEACFKAAARGDLQMIRWALDQNCGWRDVLCRAAAAGGSLHILKWAREIGCPW
ncbi:unnamed protein product, partial [Laminaria digitata]